MCSIVLIDLQRCAIIIVIVCTNDDTSSSATIAGEFLMGCWPMLDQDRVFMEEKGVGVGGPGSNGASGGRRGRQ